MIELTKNKKLFISSDQKWLLEELNEDTDLTQGRLIADLSRLVAIKEAASFREDQKTKSSSKVSIKNAKAEVILVFDDDSVLAIEADERELAILQSIAVSNLLKQKKAKSVQAEDRESAVKERPFTEDEIDFVLEKRKNELESEVSFGLILLILVGLAVTASLLDSFGTKLTAKDLVINSIVTISMALGIFFLFKKFFSEKKENFFSSSEREKLKEILDLKK